MQSFAKIRSSRKFSNLQYAYGTALIDSEIGKSFSYFPNQNKCLK